MVAKTILAICVGYGAGIWCSILALKKRALFERAKCWFTSKGRILESTLTYGPNKKQTHFRIRYEFSVGETIEGNTPRIAGGWFWNNAQQAAFVARYKPGQEVEVFYDARNPKQNCLDRTDSSGITVLWAIAIPAVILASLLVWMHLSGWGN